MATPDEPKPFTFETFTVDVEFSNVDPDLINLLYSGTPTEPEFSVEIVTPIKRTFWQWLLRRPRRFQSTFVPRARVVPDHPKDGYTITAKADD